MLNHKRHCVFNIQAHIVLVVKYRKKILSKKIIEVIENEVKELSNKYYFCVLDIGFGTDHIHLLVSYEPKISVSQIVRVLIYRQNHKLNFYDSNHYQRNNCYG